MLWIDKVTPDGKMYVSVAWKNYFVNGLGMVQTVIAGIVMFSYYIEYRQKLKSIIETASEA